MTKRSRISERSGGRRVGELAQPRREVLRRRVPVGVALPRSRPEPSGELTVGEHALERVRERCTSAGGISSPSRSSVTRSGIPPASVATTPRPRANASMITQPALPARTGRTRERARVELSRHSGRIEPGVMGHRPGKSSSRRRRARAASPADDDERRVRHAVGEPTPRRVQARDVLVRLERADEDDRRPLGQPLGRPLREGGEIAEGREDGGGRYAAALVRSARGECRDGPRRIGMPRPRPLRRGRPAASRAGARASRTAA